jgi:hypothetical protein
VLYPEVPRIYHIGYKGSHADVALHERYFRNTALNLNGYAPLGLDKQSTIKNEYKMNGFPRSSEHSLEYLSPRSHYDAFMESLFNPKSDNTVYLSSLQDISKIKGQGKMMIMFWQKNAVFNQDWDVISSYLGIWHTIPFRDAYRETIIISYAGNKLLIVPTGSFYHR